MNNIDKKIIENNEIIIIMKIIYERNDNEIIIEMNKWKK